MGVDEENLHVVVDVGVIMENCPIQYYPSTVRYILTR